jgi:hypothetical protein
MLMATWASAKSTARSNPIRTLCAAEEAVRVLSRTLQGQQRSHTARFPPPQPSTTQPTATAASATPTVPHTQAAQQRERTTKPPRAEPQPSPCEAEHATTRIGRAPPVGASSPEGNPRFASEPPSKHPRAPPRPSPAAPGTTPQTQLQVCTTGRHARLENPTYNLSLAHLHPHEAFFMSTTPPPMGKGYAAKLIGTRTVVGCTYRIDLQTRDTSSGKANRIVTVTRSVNGHPSPVMLNRPDLAIAKLPSA